MTPPKVLLLGFIGIILVGTILLSQPVSVTNNQPLNFLDALFTATSAVCVTGLTVVDTGTRFSIFGQAVILGLMQVGGVGFITMAVVISVIIGRRVHLRERLIIQESFGQIKVQGMVRLALHTLAVALAIEVIGAGFLWIQWKSDLGSGQAVWYAIFHSVSAFVNAGFDLFALQGQLSLNGYRNDWLVNLVIGSLIILGSLGLPVLDDIINRSRRRRFSLHTLLVLTMSGFLFLGGTVMLLFTETESGSFVNKLPWIERVMVAAFHSVSARTGGFSTMDLSQMSAAGLLVLMALMFIGAATASMGGGIKVNVVGALLVTLWSVAKGREEAEIFGRTIPQETIYKGLAVMISSVIFVGLITILLTITEHTDPFLLFFETVSAFGTVGYSIGVTPYLSTAGKLIIIMTMIVGRLGPLTLVATLARRPTQLPLRYPEEKILIG